MMCYPSIHPSTHPSYVMICYVMICYVMMRTGCVMVCATLPPLYPGIILLHHVTPLLASTLHGGTLHHTVLLIAHPSIHPSILCNDTVWCVSCVMVLRNALVHYMLLHSTRRTGGMRSVLVHDGYVIILLLHAYSL